jgi:hypothetical protein
MVLLCVQCRCRRRAVLYAEHSNTGGQVIWLRAERRIIFSQAKGSIPFNHAF